MFRANVADLGRTIFLKLKNIQALIINYSGVGNWVMLLPLLQEVERVISQFQYHHIFNPAIKDKKFLSWAGIKNLLSCVPSIWRRFNPHDWENIEGFLKKENINTLINLRSPEVLKIDPHYDNFKQKHIHHLDFWDMYDVMHSNLYNQTMNQNISELFRHHHISLRNVDLHWLGKRLKKCNNRESKIYQCVGFFTAASQSIKKWRLQDWIQLGILVISSKNVSINVYAGITSKEQQFATTIVNRLQRHANIQQIRLVKSLTISELAKSLATLDVLVSNDTVAVHLATAINISIIGLYFSTNSRVWGNTSDNFIAVQSQKGLKCPQMIHGQGNCTAYYDDCLAPCKEEVTPERVWTVMKEKLVC